MNELIESSIVQCRVGKQHSQTKVKSDEEKKNFFLYELAYANGELIM